jgi:hypothetical protein
MARVVDSSRAIKLVQKRIVPLSKSAPYAKVCLYGRNGKGKTRTAADAPNPVVIDVNEEGTLSVASYPGYAYFVKKWEEFIWAYWWLRSGKAVNPETGEPFETVIIDTMTQAQKLAMRHVLNEQEDRDPNRPPNFPTQRDWGSMTETVRPWIYNYRNLPMHVVFVCQERVDKNKDDDDESGEIRPRIVPDLSPGLRGDVMGAVQIMGRVYRRGVRRGKGRKEKVVWETRMLVGDHEDYETKDRTGKLGYIVRNPSMKQMIEARQSVTLEEDEEE